MIQKKCKKSKCDFLGEAVLALAGKGLVIRQKENNAGAMFRNFVS